LIQKRFASKLESKLARYALAGSAVLAAPAAANASIIYNTGSPTGLPATIQTGSTTSIDISLDGTITDFTLAVNTTPQASVSGPVTTLFLANGDGPEALASGTLIDVSTATTLGGGNLFSIVGFDKSGNWQSTGAPVQAYLGVAFDISGSTHYGWAQLIVDAVIFPGSGASISLIDYAYEDQAGVGIEAGTTADAVPEPSTLGLFALGAAGVIALRRKRQNAQS
jgi:hypothetical protein